MERSYRDGACPPYPHHLDEVGQIGGLTSLAFDHLDFFREEADYVRF